MNRRNFFKISIPVVAAASSTRLFGDSDSLKTESKVPRELLDEKQSLHWEWCGKKCRLQASEKANKILRRLDDLTNNYDSHESFYEDASDIFKKKSTLKEWLEAFTFRKELGNPYRRIHESTQGTFKNLPNLAKNKKYVIVTFDTIFEGDRGIYTEQVILRLNKNKKYKFVSFYFSHKPYYENS